MCGHPSFPSREVIIADGHSTDGTIDYLESIDDEVKEKLHLKVISGPDHGWPYSANMGLARADGNWIALANPDIVFTEDFHKLWNNARTSSYKVFSVGLKDEQGTEYFANRRVTLLRMFFLWTRVGRWVDKKLCRGFFERSFLYHSDGPILVDHPLASFMLLSRDAINRVGFLSNRYFLYLADSDFANRLNEAGIPIVHMSNLTFLHSASYSAKQRSKDKFNELMVHGMIQYARDWSHESFLRLILLADQIFSAMLKRIIPNA